MGVRMVITLKGMEDAIQISLPKFESSPNGWCYDPPEPEYRKTYLKEVYEAVDPGHQPPFVVPLLIDRDAKKMVGCDSIPLLKQMSTEFEDIAGRTVNLEIPGRDSVYEGIELANQLGQFPYKFMNADGEDKQKKKQAAIDDCVG